MLHFYIFKIFFLIFSQPLSDASACNMMMMMMMMMMIVIITDYYHCFVSFFWHFPWTLQ